MPAGSEGARETAARMTPPVLKPFFTVMSVAAALVLAAAALPGCMPSPAAEAAASRATMPSAPVDVPPKQLVQDVKRILGSEPVGLAVESEASGTLVTGWKRYRGDLHIASYWQERT